MSFLEAKDLYRERFTFVNLFHRIYHHDVENVDKTLIKRCILVAIHHTLRLQLNFRNGTAR
jgi:hypothetical protein